MRNLLQPARWALVAAGLSVIAITAGPAQEKQRSLTGTWKLNPEKMAAERQNESKDPATRQGYASGGRPRVGTGVTEPRGGGRGGGGGGVTTGLGPLGVFVRPLPQLEIVQTDSTITVSDPSGLPRTYWLDGRKETIQMPGTEPMEIVAKWKGGKLTTERKFASSGNVREVYSIAGGGTELIVEVRLTGGTLTQPMDLRRIYDAVPPKE